MPSAPQPSQERWHLLKNIFQAASALPIDEQLEYLNAACGEDADLRSEAELLFKADREHKDEETVTAGSFFDAVLAPRALAGRRIGVYEILHEIGRGGMSTVYAAARVDHQFQKLVAIKIVRPGLQFEDIVRRFQHERQLLAGLEHPNIARLLDAGVTEENLPYLVMEYVEGTRIDSYVEGNNLSVAERLTLFRSVCSAVQYAHQNLVVHRDLKPANILVNANGVPKLLDFGIAKLLRPDYYGQSLDVTLPSVQPLTPEYASPEQIRGEPVTTATDIYSLGVLLYVLLTGNHPFFEQLSSHATLTKAVLENEPTKPSAALVRLPRENAPPPQPRLQRQLRGDLDTIVLKALRKEPQRRYQSVQHLSDDLNRYLNGLPVTARRDTALYRASKFVRRHTLGVVSSVFAVLSLLVTSGLAIRSAQIAEEQRATAERRFQEGRQFAQFVLFQLDDAMRGGITPARKLTIDRALKYLDGLEKESQGDGSLELDLVEGYAKVGDLQGNLLGPNLGDSVAARASYEHALAITHRLEPIPPAYPLLLRNRIVRDRAMVNRKIANLLSLSGHPVEALARYRDARAGLEPIAAVDNYAYLDLLNVLDQMGWTMLNMGEPHKALESYTEYLRLSQRLPDRRPAIPEADVRHHLAHGYERVGYVKARLGAVQEGLKDLQQALVAYKELGAGNPQNGEVQRDIAMTYSLIGDVAAPADKVPAYTEALRITEKLAAADPQNTQYSRDRFVTLGRLANALSKCGRTSEARSVTERGVGLMQGIQAREASQYDLMTYCSILLTKPVTDSRRAQLALQFARELAERTNNKDPFALQFLAEAQDANGDSRSAVVSAQNALALLPGDRSFDSRSVIERDLAEFRTHAAHQKQN